MSRRIDICPTCKGKGEIIIDNWLTEGMTEEEIARKKEKALADIVEVVRCKDCIFASVEDGKIKCHNTYGLLVTEETEYCSRGRRREE